MSDFVLAGQAIEKVIARMHPKDKGKWATRVPMDAAKGWGLSSAQWSTELRMIQKEFHLLIAPRKVAIPVVAEDNLGQAPLDVCQTYLATKAQHEN
jgi:hypothetical protein